MSMNLCSFYVWKCFSFFLFSYDTVSRSHCLFRHCTREIKVFDDILVFPTTASRREEKRATFEAYM